MAQPSRVPLATYRIQFNRSFTFADARAIVDYLHALGITDCYASSYLCAVPGSSHGYDVADPTRLNPELGTDAEYWDWIGALRRLGMGHVLDLVPNHMGIGQSSNPWWRDVLENGPSSRFARVFDIEWRPVKAELADKVLLPILGDHYGAVLERRELQVEFHRGAFEVVYGDERIPLAPDTYATIIEGGPAAGLEAERHLPGAEAAALRRILDGIRSLPPRSARDQARMAVRARVKEVLKHRLAGLAGGSTAVRTLIDAKLRHLNGTAGQPKSFDALDRLLGAQSYRLAYWRVASEEINYRRFFDVNQLAAVRMEDPDVFEEVHRFVFELVRRGAATGLRVDHVDGLFAPGEYLRRLRERLAEAVGTSAARPYIVVEKILGQDESVPREWPVDGTTGYEFAAAVNGLFVDGRNEQAFDEIYRRFVRDRRDRPSFADLTYRSRKLVMDETMSGDINALGYQLSRFSEHHRQFRDFTLNSLTSALKEIIACFPVYRTYVTPAAPVSARDRRVIDDAIRSAKERAPEIPAVVFEFIARLIRHERLLPTSEHEEERDRLVGKFQQLTGPVAAKGVEDTALYIYNRLVSLNEVGGDPRTFGLEPGAVHAWMATRACESPGGLSATATHDSKRGEDVRARIDVLSELPGAWAAAVARWRAVNRRFKTELNGRHAPGANEEYLLYQTLVGAWPFDAEAGTAHAFRARIAAYMIKALREAKVHTSWLSPEDAYEGAVTRFVESILDRRSGNAFLQSFLPFQARIAALGIYNSLSQLVIKMTAPGVPDFYQGTELWDLNLVDPDNRRPVDYAMRAALLSELQAGGPGAGPDELFANRTDGRLKLFVTGRGLATRARLREVFEFGDYVPLAANGSRRECVFAFARQHEDTIAVTCVPRLVATLTPDAAAPPVGWAIWGDTRIDLPEDWAGRRFQDVFTGDARVPARDGESAALRTADIFERLPVALLVSSGGS